jgi:hypothetical protein
MPTDDPATPASEPVFRSVRRGFDADQVTAYLRQLGERVQGLEVQLRQAQRDLEEARNRDPIAGVSAHVADLIRGFDEEVERARAKSEADAGRIQAEARTKADLEIRQAREEAERVRADLESVRSSTATGLEAMREHMANSLREIEAALGIPAGPIMVLDEDDEEDRASMGAGVPGPPPPDAG